MKIKQMISVGAALLLTAACGTNSQSSQTRSVADAQDDQRVEMGENDRGTIEAVVVSSMADGLQVSVSQELPDNTRKKLLGDSALPGTPLQNKLLQVGVMVATRFATCLDNLDGRTLSAIDQVINKSKEFVQENLQKGNVTALYEQAGAYRGRVIELLQADVAVKICQPKKEDDSGASFSEALNFGAEFAASFNVPVKIDSDVELVLIVNCTPGDERIEFFTNHKAPVDKALENVYAQMQKFLNNPPPLKLPPKTQSQLNDTLTAIRNWSKLWLDGNAGQNQEGEFGELLSEFHWNQLSIPVKGTDLSGFFLWNRVQQLIREG